MTPLPRLHLLGLPHTVTREDFSHCAFTGKVLRFSRMMRPLGYHVTHYGVAGATSGADVEVEVMSTEEHLALLGHPYHDGAARQYGADARELSPLYQQFNLSLRHALKERVAPGDLILLPFGHAHGAAVRELPALVSGGAGAIELGVGYQECVVPWRCYESSAIYHVVLSREGRAAVIAPQPRLEWIIPNYYDLADWPVGDGLGDYLLFAGRMTTGKGLPLVLELARRRPDLEFVIAGQGQRPTDLPPNVRDVGVVVGRARAELYGRARALLALSQYPEPFGGVVVEAALCGTPAITTDTGAFHETVVHGETGIRGRTLDEWERALSWVLLINRGLVRQRAEARYSCDVVARQYDRAFRMAARALESAPYPSAEFWNT